MEEKLEKGTVISCTVTEVTSYGAWTRTEGLSSRGLITLTETSSVRIRDLSDHYVVGQVLDAMVLRHDPKAKRLILGIRQLVPDPWDGFETRFPVGTTRHGTVVSVPDYGIFVAFEDGVEGLVYIDELRHLHGFTDHPSDVFSVDDPLQVRILAIDQVNRRIALTLA